MSEDTPVYSVDEETSGHLMDVLNWALTFADGQINDDAGLKIQSVCEEIAIRFDLPIQKVEITKDDNGEWSVSIDGASEELEARNKPSLSVIEGGKQETDEDEQ